MNEKTGESISPGIAGSENADAEEKKSGVSGGDAG